MLLMQIQKIYIYSNKKKITLEYSTRVNEGDLKKTDPNLILVSFFDPIIQHYSLVQKKSSPMLLTFFLTSTYTN